MMGKVEYRISYLLRIRNWKVFVGAGAGAGEVDRTHVRDPLGRILVPGSQLKGIVRNNCEDLFETLGGTIQNPHDQDAARHSSNPILDIFGRPGDPGMTCLFCDVHFETVAPEMVVTRTRMNRMLGTVEPKSLFSTSYGVVEPGSQQKGEVRVWFPSEEDEDVHFWRLGILCSGLRLLRGLGGDKSSGAGGAEATIESVGGPKGELDIGKLIDQANGTYGTGGR